MITRRALPCLLATPALAQGLPLLVLGTGATEMPMERIAHALTAKTGRPIRTETGNAGQVAARIRAGEVVDVVVNAGPALDALIRDGLARADSRREMGRMQLGLAIRQGAYAPAIADEASLAAVLRSATSIAHSDGAAGATSGRHVMALLARLGIPEEAAGGPRRMPFPRGLLAVQAVARGEAALVITQASEILAEPGAALVAPLPESAQLVTPYVAAIPASARDPVGARAFIEFAGREGAAMFRAAGFQVGPNLAWLPG